MRVSYLVFFLSFSVWAQTTPSIEVIPEPKNIEDFEHQYKGCLANSECDQIMGLQLQRWSDIILKVKSDKVEESKRPQYLELFRSKYGIPVEFYTTQKSQQGFKPLMFNSPCKDHNPKQKDQQILRGKAFVKSITKDKAIIWRDQAQMEISTESLFIPQPVTVYYPDGPKTYFLPLDEQPLFIKNKELFVLMEEDDFFFVLKINETGEWKIENVNMTRLTEWQDKKQNISCPKEKTKLAPKVFGVEFCKNIWDEDLKKTLPVRLHEGCVL